MTMRGFCVVAALSRYTSGFPCTLRSRIGKSLRICSTSYDALRPFADVFGVFDLVNAHLHFVAFDGDRVCLHGADGGEDDGAPGLDIELRAVARAFDAVTLELALVERSAVVRADVVDRVELAVYVAERDAFSIDLVHADSRGRRLARLRDRHEALGFRRFFRHALKTSSYVSAPALPPAFWRTASITRSRRRSSEIRSTTSAKKPSTSMCSATSFGMARDSR